MSRSVHVALTPQHLPDPIGVAVVVDVLRATTTLVILVERGCAPVLLAPTIEAARAAAARRGLLLVGEQYGLPPEGFDYGNSPAALAEASVAGRGMVLATTNGVPAIHAVAGAELVLAGALRNAHAVAVAACEATPWDGAITILCAGRQGSPGSFGLDDAYCAGVIVRCLEEAGDVTLTDAALAARLLADAAPDALRLFEQSAAGRHLARIGCAADVVLAAEVNRSRAAPTLGRDFHLLKEGEL